MQQTILTADTLPMEAGVDSVPFPDALVAGLGSAFMELDEEHRIVLCLHYLERLSLKEVAQVLDDTLESVCEVYLEAVTLLGGEAGLRRNAA